MSRACSSRRHISTDQCLTLSVDVQKGIELRICSILPRKTSVDWDVDTTGPCRRQSFTMAIILWNGLTRRTLFAWTRTAAASSREEAYRYWRVCSPTGTRLKVHCWRRRLPIHRSHNNTREATRYRTGHDPVSRSLACCAIDVTALLCRSTGQAELRSPEQSDQAKQREP